jgi:hypothetical protein
MVGRIIAIPLQLFLASLQWLNFVFAHSLAIQCMLAPSQYNINKFLSLLVPSQYDEKNVVVVLLGTSKRVMLVVPVMSSSISILVLCCSCVSLIASNRNVNEFICNSLWHHFLTHENHILQVLKIL